MKNHLEMTLRAVVSTLGIDPEKVFVDHTENLDHGDYTSNIALVSAKQLKKNPKQVAEEIISGLAKSKPDFVSDISIAGAGFINFRVKDSSIAELSADHSALLSRPQKTKGKVMVEYTDPNPFKIFHIGHLMANSIGESISRLVEYSGHDVIRACYQGDKGLHVAKTIKGMLINESNSDFPARGKTIIEKVDKLGKMYVVGNTLYEESPEIKRDIEIINKKIYDGTDPKINELYNQGRKWSLEYFDYVYARLGSKFDTFYFESEIADTGLKVVEKFLKKDLFEKSEGAIVFKGEEFGLHTRVFVNSQGLPTYEAKELGLNITKFNDFPKLEKSIIVTGNEINDYFKVLKKVLSLVAPDVAEKTVHVSHGMLRFTEGKMSSRKGNIIAAEDLIGDIKKKVIEKMAGRELNEADQDEISDQIAIGAIKYSILRQATGGDVIFDVNKSVSFEGDSGPYLQYSAVRANSILEKAKAAGIKSFKKGALPEKVGMLERVLVRSGEVFERAAYEYAPQQIANYLITLAGAFNSFYAETQIVDEKDPLSPYKVELTRSFMNTMIEGLNLLGIKVPKKM